MPSRVIQHNYQMYVIWHYHIFFYINIFAMAVDILYTFFYLCSDLCQFIFQEGTEALPYDFRQ